MYVTLGSLTKHVSLKLINIFRTLRQMKHNLAYVSIKENNLAKPGTQVALPGSSLLSSGGPGLPHHNFLLFL